MFPSRALLQRVCRLTLFTRANCSLCDDAKTVLSHVWDKRPFEYTEIDVMSPGQGQWKNRYEFDTPVLHVEKAPGKDNHPTSAEARKLMHRFKEADVERLMDEAGKDATPSS